MPVFYGYWDFEMLAHFFIHCALAPALLFLRYSPRLSALLG